MNCNTSNELQVKQFHNEGEAKLFLPRGNLECNLNGWIFQKRKISLQNVRQLCFFNDFIGNFNSSPPSHLEMYRYIHDSTP